MSSFQCLRTLLLTAAAVGAPLAAQAQYRCAQPGGSTSFQQQPCAAGAKGEKLSLPSAPDAGAERPIEIRQGIAARRPVIGMTVAELKRALGEPDSASVRSHGDGDRQQFVYRSPARTLYVNTIDGLVHAIHEGEGTAATAAPAPAPPARSCPSDREIRDIEMEMSKIQNRDKDRLQAELRRQLAQAKACSR